MDRTLAAAEAVVSARRSGRTSAPPGHPPSSSKPWLRAIVFRRPYTKAGPNRVGAHHRVQDRLHHGRHAAVPRNFTSVRRRPGRPSAGQIVPAGSLVQTQWPAAGDEVTVIISGLGSVSVTFAAPVL